MAIRPKTKPLDVKSDILWRIYVVMLIMLVGAMILILRIGSIQYIEGKDLLIKANLMHIQEMSIKATRGNILADDGHSLFATSLPYFQVHWDIMVVPEDTFMKYVDTLAICLASYIDDEYTPGAYRQRLIDARERGDKYFKIRQNVSFIELERLKTFPIFRMGGRLKSGLIEEEMAKRQYPFKMLAHRTIGYNRVTDQGSGAFDTIKVGLEGTWNHILAGEEGKRDMQQLSKDIWVPVNDITKIEPRPGKDIVTTINVDIQDVAEKALLESLQTYEGQHGCVIVMEVKTGAIKAIANIGFNEDRTQFWEDYNYAIGENIEPGSTFKLASIMTLLEDGHVKLDDTINLNQGKWQFYDAEMEDASAHGLYLTTMEQAFEMSSNVGIAKMIQKYYNGSTAKQETFIRRLSDFMLDKKTGIEIDGEREPFIKDPNRQDWSGITAPWMSIGYELEMSALQLLTFYNTVANGGQMMKPMIVKEIRSYGTTEKVFQPKIVKRKIASKNTLEKATYLLTRVVESKRGTAHSIYTPAYKIAGKTGTAIMNWKAHEAGREAKKYRASFAGFFPADNPVYSCIVVITNPKSGLYGGRIAAPVFRKIADYCHATSVESHKPINQGDVVYTDATLPKLQVGFKTDLMALMKHLNMPFKDASTTAWAVGFVENDSLSLLTRNIQEDVVPNVVGMGLKDALYLLENQRLRVRVVGVGKVKSQSVKPGRNIHSVQTITLVLG